MTARTNQRNTDFAGLIPARGTFPIAADTILKKGWMCGLDSSGYLQEANTIANGCVVAIGKVAGTQDFDNSTGSTLGGAAGAVDVEVEYGVFGWENKTTGGDTILADDVGKVCYAVDNQTVALTNDSDTLPIAGYVSEVRDGQIWVHQGISVAAQIVIAASEASQLDTAQTDIDAAEVNIANLETDAAVGFIPAPVETWRIVSASGDVGNIAAIGGVTASDTAPILRGNAAETFELSWATGSVIPISRSFVLPVEFDDAANVTIDLWVYSGATDAATFTVETGWDNGALVSDSASDAGTKSATLHKITATVAHADIPAGARLLTVALTPTNAHASDAYQLLGVAINFTNVLT